MSSSRASVRNAPEIIVGRQCFSLAQANRALVLVGRIVRDVVGGYQNVLDYQEILELTQARPGRERIERLQRELLKQIERLQGFSDELLDVGVELKDWAEGYVDFPAEMDGRRVMLCWRHGEPAVSHWHSADAACDARQAIAPAPAAA